MKLIISRKGFDSSAGGCPNPILPNGSLLALPIPDSQSVIKYRDIVFAGQSIGNLVNHLTNGRHKPSHKAHLDPDLIPDMYPRENGWKPLLGQTGSAQGHLALQQVDVGDTFLFFGLFREVEKHQRKWRYIPGTKPKHVLWGWLQIGEIKKVDELGSDMPWVQYHPHLQYETDPYNTLYIAAETLSLEGKKTRLPGSGIFKQLDSELCLTAPGSTKPSYWQLPAWFYPNHRTPLTYHSKLERWSHGASLGTAHCNLQCAARGQEFVLNAGEYPEVSEWLKALVQTNR